MTDEQIAQKGVVSNSKMEKLALGPDLLARVEAGEAEPNQSWQSLSLVRGPPRVCPTCCCSVCTVRTGVTLLFLSM